MGETDGRARLQDPQDPQEPPEGGAVTGRFGVVVVDGPSMAPTLAHGDHLLCHYGARLRPGAVVVAQHPLRQDLLVVKRAVERRAYGWWLLSDNSAVESDSRDYGPVPDSLVLGRVLLRFSPKPAWLAPSTWWHPALRALPYGFARRLGDFRRLPNL
ncbi:nickel-type superoxide dismutase maturation protease [Streptacidiphilus sp. MAP12-20]|uniref:nickel-type superoxide dismutase maturation protease n=1 Tax=Streptacidiphilus sp. MAP12-20 TaxID=3156299 RepID=UPI003511F484